MPLIDRKTIDQVYQAVNIVDVVGEFVTLRKAGANYKGLCPFHDEKTPSFVVTPSRGTCHCFGCHKGGNAVTFLMTLNNWSYPEAIRWLAKKYNIEVIESQSDEKTRQEQKHRDHLLSLNQWANEYFQHTLHETDEGKAVGMTYLRNRGFRDDIIHKFQLGYCPSARRALYEYATANRYKTDSLVEVGLCIKPEQGRPYDRFHGRVIFPVHNQMGKVVAFGGRILEKRDNTGKYVNSPESAIYSKSRELYGIYFARQAIQRQGCCYMVEGYTDVISMHQCGIENVVASSGTALTHDQIRLIKKFTTNMTVLYDGDNAGIMASLRGIDMFLEHGFNIKVLLLPDGDDPDSFARKHNAEDYVKYINDHQVDFIRFKTNLLLDEAGDDIQRRSQVINNIARSIALIDDTITRSLYIKECANLTQIHEEDVIETVTSLRNKNKLRKLQEQQRGNTGTTRPQQPADDTDTPQADPRARSQSSETEKAETNLIKHIIRYGEMTVQCEDAEGHSTELSLATYVASALQADDMELKNPLYTTIINEVVQNLHIPNFKATTYLLAHPNDQIRDLALSLSSDREWTIAVNDDSMTRNLRFDTDKLISELGAAILEDKIAEAFQLISSGTLSEEDTLKRFEDIQYYKKVQNMLRQQYK